MQKFKESSHENPTERSVDAKTRGIHINRALSSPQWCLPIPPRRLAASIGPTPAFLAVYQTEPLFVRILAGATGTQISSAVSSCSIGIVFLNAETYNLSDQIFMNTSNVTLRGAGANQTILVGGPVIQSVSGNFTNLGTTITAGGTKGTNAITVSSTALSVGTVIEVDRADDTNLVVNTGHQGGGTRNLVQANAITAINGNVLTVRNPWVYDFTSSASAKIKDYWSSMHANVGFENFKIEHNGANGTVSIN